MKAKLKTKLAKAGVAAASAASLACAFPTLAFASEEKEGIAVLIPDMNEFIPMLVAFIIILIVLAKFGWPVVDNIITKRESTIKEALKKSEEAQAEAERTLAEYKRQLEEAKAQSAKIIADAKATGEAVKADITNKAQAESAQMIEKARGAIEAEKKAAVAELQGSIADLSVDVASRLVGHDLNDDEHRKIIEHYVTAAGRFNA